MIICFVRGPSRRNILPISKSGVSLYLNTNMFVTRCFIFDQKKIVYEPKHFSYIFAKYCFALDQTYFIIYTKSPLYLNPNLFSYIFAKYCFILDQTYFILYICAWTQTLFLGFLPNVVLYFVKHFWLTRHHEAWSGQTYCQKSSR